jgi:hypothetical protein
VAQLTCADGAVLTVLPVPVLDRDGQTYEFTPSSLDATELLVFVTALVQEST